MIAPHFPKHKPLGEMSEGTFSDSYALPNWPYTAGMLKPHVTENKRACSSGHLLHGGVMSMSDFEDKL